MFNKLLLLIVISILSSCAFAPLNNTKTASSLGEGNWQVDAGLSPAAYVTAERGITENFDLGITYESQVLSVLALTSKYSFINNREGFSLAGLGSLFMASSSSGYYFGSIAGYKSGWFETYLSARYNHVSFNDITLTSDDQDDLFFENFSIPGASFKYLQFNIGFNFWFEENFGMNLAAKLFASAGDDFDTDGTIIPAASLMWRL